MTIQPVFTPAMQRQVAEIARAAAKQALSGRPPGSLVPATITSFDYVTHLAIVVVDGDTASSTAAVLSDGFDWYSPGDRVMVQFEPPAGFYVVGRIGGPNSELLIHDDFTNTYPAWTGGVGSGDTPWVYTLATHTAVPFGGLGTGWLGGGYTGAIVLQTGTTIGYWTQIRKSAASPMPLPGYPLRFRGRFGVDGAITQVLAQAGVGDASAGVAPTNTGFWWRIREPSAATPVFELVSMAGTSATVATLPAAGTPVLKTMYDFIIEWKPSSFVRGWIKTPTALFGPVTITTNVPAANALVNPLFASAYPYAASVRYGVIDYLRLERCASLT